MYSDENRRKITWYRSRLDRETLKSLNQRSDWKGWLEVLGHLSLVVLTGTAAVYAQGRFPLGVLFLILFFHGTFYAFLGNGSHELSHNSVLTAPKDKSLGFLIDLLADISISMLFSCFDGTCPDNRGPTISPQAFYVSVCPMATFLRFIAALRSLSCV